MSSDNPSQPDANLNQIRDLLFGDQARSFDCRIEALQKELHQAVAKLGAQLNERCDQIGNRLATEVQKLREEIRSLDSKSEGRHEELSAEISRVQTQLESELRTQVTELKETLKLTEQTLRSESQHEQRAIRELVNTEVQSVRDQMRSGFEQTAAATVSRRVLSNALRDLSSMFDDGLNQVPQNRSTSSLVEEMPAEE